MSKKTSKPKAKKIKVEGAAPSAATENKNGIPRPREGTACRAIWDTLDALKADGKELTFEALRLAVDTKTADATIRTQRQRWRQYHAEKKDGQ